MKKTFALMLLSLVACQTKDRYDPSSFYDRIQQDRIITGIIAHIYTPPPYVLMSDRLKPEYRDYYLTQMFRFNLLKLYVTEDSTHYFLIERPAPGVNHRVVGGQFKLSGNELVNFKEIFVTPSLPSKDLIERSE